MNISTYGYLGVELFFAINGFLITKSILKSYRNETFSYFRFLVHRIVRLWPLVLLAGVVSLVIGYFNMLPDDLENVGQAVVASNVFMNNALASITTKNYWAVSQLVKPLMHTWYLGIIAQFYVVYPLIVMVVHKIGKKTKAGFETLLMWTLGVLTVISLILYMTATSGAFRFYHLPYRFFELSIGGLLAVYLAIATPKAKEAKGAGIKKLLWIAVPCLAALFAVNAAFMPDMLRLLLVVALSGCAILYSANVPEVLDSVKPYRWVAYIGKISYSIFICHQVILAFYRYIINATPTWYEHLLILALIALVSALCYFAVEKKIAPIQLKKQLITLGVCFAVCIVSTIAGLYLYVVAGVVRDVPELDVYTNDIHRGMHAEYCDRVYKMDQEFADDGRIKVLVVGDSFGRDWVNVLLESDIADQLDISYIYTDNLSETYRERISKADYVFIRAETAVQEKFPGWLLESVSEDAVVYGIGTKRYGITNGNVYANRHRDDYLKQTVSFQTDKELYEAEKALFGDHYIDFIAPVLSDNGEVYAFTDDGKYISQDCRHLTKSGAQYYARIFDLVGLFGLEKAE